MAKPGRTRRVLGAPYRGTKRVLGAVTYPVRHPFKSTAAVGRPVLRKAGKLTYPIRHPLKSTARTYRGVVRVWDSRTGRFTRMLVPYAAGGVLGAYFTPAVPLAGAGIGAFLTRAGIKRDGLAAKTVVGTGKTAYAVGSVALKGGARGVSDVWSLSVDAIKARTAKSKEGKGGTKLEEYLREFPPEQRTEAARMYFEYHGNVPTAEAEHGQSQRPRSILGRILGVFGERRKRVQERVPVKPELELDRGEPAVATEEPYEGQFLDPLSDPDFQAPRRSPGEVLGSWWGRVRRRNQE